MKKIIAILFILLIGLGVLVGCTTTADDSNREQPSQAQPEPKQLPDSRNDDIIQPPALPEE